MKRFLITNPRFTGEAEIIYNENALLMVIDISNTSMGENMIANFKRAVPAHCSPENLAAAFTGETTIVAADLEITWEMFYGDWPYKRNAHVARKLWDKMNSSDQAIAWHNKKDYIGYCKRQQAKYEYQPMMADSYLRKREFETDWKKLK